MPGGLPTEGLAAELPGDPAGQAIQTGAMPALADGFIARPETAPGLGAALVPGAAVALVPSRAAIEGSRDWLRSCGKTQLATGFATSLWQSRQLELLVWVNATSRASVLSGYMEAVTAALRTDPDGDAETLAARFLSWLRETRQPWLVVLDGLSDAADLAGIWPEGPAGMVLITATDPAAVAGEHRPLTLPVGVFSPREALSFVMGRLTADPDQRLGAIDLIKDLGCEPLALAQASGVIETSTLSCRDYRSYFQRRRDQMIDPEAGEPAAGAVTWTFSAEQADRLSPDGAAQAVLALAAVLDGNGIPGAIFTTSVVRSYVAGDSGEAPAEPDRIRHALLVLQRVGLVSIDPDDNFPTIRMSPVVQAAIQQAMPERMFDRAASAAASALLEAWPAEEPSAWLGENLRSCAISLQRAYGDRLWDSSCHPLLLATGRSMGAARLTGPAVAYWRELGRVSDRILGSDHPDTLAVGEQLANAYLAAGQAREAVPWFQWILARQIHGLGAEHASAIAARRDLGRALTAANQLSDAITVLDEATRDYERVLGADHPDTLGARDELAAAYRSAGQFDDSIALSRHTLADRERVQGSQHADATNTRQQLASAYLAANRLKDAISQYKKVLSSRERVLGPDHMETIAAQGDLGTAYHVAGRMASALQLYEQARMGYERVLGADHPVTLSRSAALGNAYYTAGRLTDAATLLRDTLERCERVLPAGDPLTRGVQEILANIVGN